MIECSTLYTTIQIYKASEVSRLRYRFVRYQTSRHPQKQGILQGIGASEMGIAIKVLLRYYHNSDTLPH